MTVIQQVDEVLGETAQRHETWHHVGLQGRQHELSEDSRQVTVNGSKTGGSAWDL